MELEPFLFARRQSQIAILSNDLLVIAASARLAFGVVTNAKRCDTKYQP